MGAKNLTRKSFSIINGQYWTAPGGVKTVRAKVYAALYPQLIGGSGYFMAITSPYISASQGSAWFGCGHSANLNVGFGNCIGTGGGSSPLLVTSIPTITQISANSSGFSHSIALDNGGAAYAFGTNVFGQCGTNNTTGAESVSAVVTGYRFRQVAAGYQYSLFIDGPGNLYGCGNTVGSGLGSIGSTPVLIATAQLFSFVAANGSSNLAINASNGAAYAWGVNTSGALGTGSATTPIASPTLVVGGLAFKYVTTDGASTPSCYGITTAGDMYAWGNNANGQLGDGSVTFRSSPVLVSGGLKWLEVSAAPGSVVGLATDSQAYTWGANTNGQLAQNDVVPRSTPTLVTGYGKFVHVSMAGYSANIASPVAVSGRGTAYFMGPGGSAIYGAGDNSFAQLGTNGATTADKSTPTLMSTLPFTTNIVRENFVAELDITVTPGSTYTITVVDNNIRLTDFSSGVIVPVYAGPAKNFKLVLEYDA